MASPSQAAEPEVREAWDTISSSSSESRLALPNVTQAASEFLGLVHGLPTTETPVGARSLKRLAFSATVQSLESSLDLKEDIMTLMGAEAPVSLYEILIDPNTRYPLQCRLINALRDAGVDAYTSYNLDDLIRLQECSTRSSGSKDNRYLVDLSTLLDLLTLKPELHPTLPHPVVALYRQDVDESFDLLHRRRPQILYLNPTQNAFNSVFNRLTGNLLAGLNWEGVLVAGGIVLAALTQVDPNTDLEILGHDIDIYLYGLSPQEANTKIEEIYRVWLRNLPPFAVREKVVVRNTKTITFLAHYPVRRVQIVLKLSRSATDVLLNFDLDQCAMGFNGTTVLMLPRCARALETGYTVFCSDLVCGHSSQTRRSTQIGRVLKYADRGFGIRFLPSYVRELGDITDASRSGVTNYQPGQSQSGLQQFSHASQRAEAYLQGLCHRVHLLRADEYTCQIGGRRGLGSLDMFMRYCKAWEVGHDRLTSSLQITWTGESYDEQGDTYDDPASLDYNWNSSFRSNILVDSIDAANAAVIFRTLRSQANRAPGDIIRKNPAEVQRYIYGADLTSVLDTELCMPLVVPQALETALGTKAETSQTFGDLCPSTPVTTSMAVGNKEMLFVSDASLRPVAYAFDLDEPLSLRWWVPNKQTMWSGEHGIRDNLTELLTMLATWLSYVGRRASDPDVLSEKRERDMIFGLRLVQEAINKKKRRKMGPKTSPSSSPSLVATLPPEERSFIKEWASVNAEPLLTVFPSASEDTADLE